MFNNYGASVYALLNEARPPLCHFIIIFFNNEYVVFNLNILIQVSPLMLNATNTNSTFKNFFLMRRVPD